VSNITILSTGVNDANENVSHVAQIAEGISSEIEGVNSETDQMKNSSDHVTIVRVG
jgi:hypothetical protein